LDTIAKTWTVVQVKSWNILIKQGSAERRRPRAASAGRTCLSIANLFRSAIEKKDVDDRHKAGHDGRERS
jgi:hypothetical protein